MVKYFAAQQQLKNAKVEIFSIMKSVHWVKYGRSFTATPGRCVVYHKKCVNKKQSNGFMMVAVIVRCVLFAPPNIRKDWTLIMGNKMEFHKRNEFGARIADIRSDLVVFDAADLFFPIKTWHKCTEGCHRGYDCDWVSPKSRQLRVSGYVCNSFVMMNNVAKWLNNKN